MARGVLLPLIWGRFGRLRRLGPPRNPSLALLALFLLASCAGGGGGSAGTGGSSRADARCGADIEEPLDVGSIQHLLPGAPEPTYSSDPPTSGPHLSGGAPEGAQDGPVSRPAQVALLEQGGVMLQYRDATPATVRRLRTLSQPEVVVAPNPSLASPVIATAWRHRLTCGGASGPALDALQAFVEAHKGEGPER